VVGNETHFMVISYWDSLEAVRGLAGNDIHAVHPLPRDAEFLLNPESTVRNYEIVDDKHGP
jgi:heme-degrading monooxygenase HmoA